MLFTQQNINKNCEKQKYFSMFFSDRHFLTFYNEHILKYFKSLLIHVYENISQNKTEGFFFQRHCLYLLITSAVPTFSLESRQKGSVKPKQAGSPGSVEGRGCTFLLSTRGRLHRALTDSGQQTQKGLSPERSVSFSDRSLD